MTIKEIVFRPPLNSPSQSQLLLRVARTEPTVLPVGKYDVTPNKNYRDKYEVTVTDPGSGDTVGEMVVTRQGGKEITYKLNGRVQKTTDKEKRIHLRRGSPPVVLARPNAFDNPKDKGITVHGIVYYDPE